MSKEKKLKFYAGQGYSYSLEDGIYEVRITSIKRFTKLSEARKYYDSLYEKKTIWDITNIPELLESHNLEEDKLWNILD